MKTKNLSLIAAAFVLLLSAGCASVNSGNIGGGIKPLPYATNEKSVVTKETIHTNECGEVSTTVERTTKTGLAVNEGIQHGRLKMTTDVGVAQAKGSSGGFWTGLFGPTPGYPNTFVGTTPYGTYSTGSGEGGRNYIYSH